MPIEVHQEYLKRRYVAPWCSIACFINFLIIAGALILPLYIAWASHNFWIKEQILFEQPRVTYTHQYIVFLTGYKGLPPTLTNTAPPKPFQIAWTTSPNANDMLGNIVRPPTLKSRATDFNLDGRPDELLITATMPLADDEVVTGVQAIAFINAQFSSVAKAKFDGLSVASYTSNVPGTGYIADGDLQLQQRSTLPYVSDGIFVPYLNDPLVSLDAATALNQVLPDAILGQYRDRNFTTFLNVPYPLWEPEFAYSPSLASAPGSLVPPNRGLSGTGRTFTTTMKVRIAPTAVLIRPPVSQELKYGWIQYLSFLVLTVFVGWLLRKVLFAYHVLETSIFVDAPRSKLHVE